jgi:hypothetical protein
MMPALLAVTAYAVETKVWTQSEAAEFEKGTLKGLALASDGRLSLAPVWKELHDAAIPHLWCAASDAKGNVYAAGAEGKVLALDSKGKARTLATLEGGAVYALTVSRTGDLFAAVSPAAKIYRIDASGKASLYATLKASYIWSLVWGTDGLLYAATGDPGQIHKISAAGQATVFFDSEETHVRSLVTDGKGNFIAGTEPGGVVLRISNTGDGFVLYQTAKREVTALAVGADGAVYAAASGARTAASAAPSTAPPVPIPAPQPTGAQAAAPPGAARPAAVAPPPTLGATPAGGSEIYRIAPDGEPRRLWSNAQLTVYALTLDKDGKLLAGTGNQGRVYRIDSEFVYTRLADSEPQQITALAPLAGGGVVAVTANPAKVFQLGPSIEKAGTIESELFDATAFTYWGRLRHEAILNGGAIRLEARSGNLDRARKNWSPWTTVDPKGERIAAPPARFLGWRATLTAAADGRSPVLNLVEAAYQAKNVAPVIERIEVTPPNYRFPSPGTSLIASSNTLSLPAFGQTKRTNPAASTSSESGAATLTFEKGSTGARWKASDANGDSLEYKVEIRGSEEREWKLLKEKVKEARLSWDGSGLADGRYRLRVTASDDLDNYPGQGLTAQLESDEFIIDNTPPELTGLTARVEGAKIVLKFAAEDALTPLQFAEFSINAGRWIAAQPTTRMTDSQRHEYSVESDKPIGNEFTIAVKVADENDNMTVKKVTIR